jgi:hypothetical protein
MTKKLMFAFFAAAVAANGIDAQTDTITNRDLEKYRSERLKAETDLRENYKRLGFPSPEELRRRNAEAAKATAELSARLRTERLERERIAAIRAQQTIQPTRVEVIQGTTQPQIYWSTGYWRVHRQPRPRYFQPGYFAGGAFWPVGSPIRREPRVRRPRH